jgi:hypothetical protein
MRHIGLDFNVTIWHYKVMPTTLSDRPNHRLLLGHLQKAEADHDRGRRDSLSGVTTAALDGDKALWTNLGMAIGALAHLISVACAASALGERRPEPDHLAVRLSESIDDQIDRDAWLMVDAAARLRAAAP